MATESEIMREFLGVASVRLPDIRFFRRNVGVIRMEGGRVFRSAAPGQCDLYAIVKGSARHLELECKAYRGVLSPEQIRWRDFCQNWGIPWALLRAGKDETTAQTCHRWCDEVLQIIS